MTFAGLVLLGIGTVLVWAALTGEHPVDAIADVLSGGADTRPTSTTPQRIPIGV